MALRSEDDGRPAGTGLGRRLWDAAEGVAMESLHSPFVTALAQGTLPRTAFQHYVGQDAFFLQFFARAYALALAKCDPAHISQATFEHLTRLLKGVHEELRLHRSYAASWGVDLATAVATPATRAYTDFLMDVANDTATGLAEVLCAMAPCARLYGFIGCTLARAFPGASHSYSDWIQTYSSRQYMEVPELKEQMVEEAALASGVPEDGGISPGSAGSGPTPSMMTAALRVVAGGPHQRVAQRLHPRVERSPGRLHKLYLRAMQLEADFFGAHPQIPTTRAIRCLVVDFDDTCTQLDTCSLLFDAAAAARERVDGPGAGEKLREQGRQLTAAYMQRYRELMAQALPTEPSRPAAAVPYDAAGLAAFLDRLSDFDTAMLQPVIASGILAGLRDEDLAAAARQVALRQGCRAVLQRIAAAGLPVHILSINWSSQLILRVLDLGQVQTLAPPPDLGPPPYPGLTQLLVGGMQTTAAMPVPAAPVPGSLVVANHLETAGETGETTGKVTSIISSARDKAWALRALVGGSSATGASVYVGDSLTDLAALLVVDVGIVVGSSSSLRSVCKRYGVTLRPLITAPLQPPANAPHEPGTLYEASGWPEIEAFLFGPRSYEAHPYKAQMQAVRAAWPPSAAAAGTPALAGDTAANGVAPQPAGEAATLTNNTGHVPPPPSIAVPRVLTIAGSDSGGGAGIQADLKAIMACSVFGTSAITALTAQNTQGVQDVHVTPLASLAQQINSVLGDIGAGAVKTGMLPTADAVRLVAEKVRQYGVAALVVDPVMVTTSGHSLAGSDVMAALLEHLTPLATLVTPNIPEASALLGGRSIARVTDMEAAARALHEKLRCRAVLLKGGHLAAHGPLGATATVTDVFFDGIELHVLEQPLLETGNTHGTGCTLASAIAAYLARGHPLLPAIQAARAYLHSCLRHSSLLAVGAGPQRPFNHGWQLSDWQGRGATGADGGAASRWDPARVAAAMALYAVTDSGMNAKRGRTLEEAVAGAVAGGATIIQVREKDCDGGVFLQRAAAALKVCRAAGVPLVINDRVDVALALGPDVGVHVGQSDLPVATVRALLGPGRLLGVSTKTPEQARAALLAGADYLGVGAVYPTGTKDGAIVIGLEGLAAVCDAAAASGGAPVVAIGGIKAQHIPEVLGATGAAGVALVSALFDVPDVAAATHELYGAVVRALATKAGEKHRNAAVAVR